MDDLDTIDCPYCGEWQHLDNVDKQELIEEFRYATLECKDCKEEYLAAVNIYTRFEWVIEKLPKKEKLEEQKIKDVPDQLFFPFHKS